MEYHKKNHITIDDGPVEILQNHKILKAHSAKATFFLLETKRDPEKKDYSDYQLVIMDITILTTGAL